MSDDLILSRTLPERPNLEHLHGQAKALLQALRAGDADAARRLKVSKPDLAPDGAKLADAQLAVAREYGFASWPRLVAHVEALTTPPAESLIAAFREAVSADRVDEVRQLLAREPGLRSQVNAPIFAFGARAVSHAKRSAAMLDLLTEHGADPNLKSDWWAGPWGVLDMATPAEAELLLARGAELDVFSAAHLDRLDVLRAMLDADPTLVHAKGGDGCRPLHFARSAAAIDLLLERGAEIDARDVDHVSTAAQWAVRHDARSLEACRLLLARGATPDVFMAAAIGDVDVLRALVDADASLTAIRVGAKDYPPCPPAPGEPIYTYTLGRGRTPLEIAAAFKNDACVALLMARSTPVQRWLAACTMGDVVTARAMLAARPSLPSELQPTDHQALPMTAWEEKLETTRLMLDVGFDPFAHGPDTGTALHCACWRGRADIVEMILTHDHVRPRLEALLATKDPTHNATPLGWCQHGAAHCRNPAGDYAKVEQLLRERGAS